MAMDGMMSTSSGLSYHNVGDFYPRKFGPKPDVVPSGVTERKVGPLDKPDMVSVDVINIKDSDVPLHRKKLEHDSYVLGTIHPFRRTHRSIFGKLQQEFRLVASDRRSWRILLFGSLNLLCTGCLLMWCSSTNSMVVHTDVRCVYGQCGSCLPPTLNPLRDLIAQEEEQHATLDPANTAASHTHTHTHRGGVRCRADRKRRTEVSNTRWEGDTTVDTRPPMRAEQTEAESQYCQSES